MPAQIPFELRLCSQENLKTLGKMALLKPKEAKLHAVCWLYCVSCLGGTGGAGD